MHCTPGASVSPAGKERAEPRGTGSGGGQEGASALGERRGPGAPCALRIQRFRAPSAHPSRTAPPRCSPHTPHPCPNRPSPPARSCPDSWLGRGLPGAHPLPSPHPSRPERAGACRGRWLSSAGAGKGGRGEGGLEDWPGRAGRALVPRRHPWGHARRPPPPYLMGRGARVERPLFRFPDAEIEAQLGSLSRSRRRPPTHAGIRPSARAFATPGIATEPQGLLPRPAGQGLPRRW